MQNKMYIKMDFQKEHEFKHKEKKRGQYRCQDIQ